MPCEDRGRDQSEASKSQGIPRIAGSQQKLGEGHGTDSPSERSRRTNPANTWFQISSFQNQETIKFCCFKPHVCGTLLWRP